MGELFAQIHRFHLTNEDAGAFGNLHAGQSGDGHRTLTHDLGVQCAVDEQHLADLVDFVFLEEVAAAAGKFLPHLIINAVQHDDRLLAGADHAVVKGLGVDDGADRELNVGGVVNDGGGVPRANAQSGLAGGISGLHHAGAAGGEDDVRFPHQGVGHFQTGNIDPADDALRRTGGNGGLQNHLGGGNGGFLCSGMGADKDAVAGLQRNHGLEDGGGCGVGGGDNSGNHADRLGNSLDAVCLILLNDAAGLGVLVGIVDVLGGQMVFQDFVLNHAHAGFRDGQLCQRDTGLIGGGGGGQEDLVYLLLGVGGEFGLSGPDTCEGFFQRLDAVNDGIVHDDSSLDGSKVNGFWSKRCCFCV